MRKIAFSLFWIYVLSIPLERTLVFPGFGTITRVLGGCAFGAWLIFAIRSGSIRKPAPFHTLFMVFVFWGLLTYTWSIEPDLSWPRMLTRAQLPLMLWLIWELAVEAREQRSLMQAYCFGVSIVCLQIINNYFRLASLLTAFFPRYSAFDVDPNMTALRVALAVPMAIYLAGAAEKAWLRWWNWSLIPFAIMAVILTGSRSGVLALLAGLLFLPAAFTSLSRGKKATLAAGAILSVVGLYYVISPTMMERLMTIPTEVQKVVEGNKLDANIRILVWEKGLEKLPDHLFGGVGIGAFREGVAQDFRGGHGMSAHNTFIAVLVEEGIIGFGLLLGLIGILLVSTLRMKRLERWLFLALMATWSVSVVFIQQHDKQHSWFIMGLIAVHAGSTVSSRAAPVAMPRAAVLQ